jgi:hypothetical protein
MFIFIHDRNLSYKNFLIKQIKNILFLSFSSSMPKKTRKKSVKRLGAKESLKLGGKVLDKNSDSKTIDKKTNEKKEQHDVLKSFEKQKNFKELVLKHNKMEMPDDFYDFLEFCISICPEDPKSMFNRVFLKIIKAEFLCLQDALKDLDIQLVGLYDLLLTNLETDYKLYYRYSYDPPEFQTVLKGNDDLMLHLGYFRDDPNELPSFVALNEAKNGCTIIPKGDNLFSAVNWYLDELIISRRYKIRLEESTINRFKDKLVKWCDKKHSLELKTSKIKARDKIINCKTFHGAGLSVPVTSDGFGYRDLPHSYDSLKKILKNYLSADSTKKTQAEDLIQEIITLIQFANDESDYGMGLELGLCLFSYGDESLHKYVKMLLSLGYNLLGRNYYADIITAHLDKREMCIKE